MGNIPYENFKIVDADWRPGIAKVLLNDSTTFYLAVRSLENHGEFIRQLSERLNETQIGNGFQKLAQPRRFAALQTVIYVLAFLPSVILLMGISFERYPVKILHEELNSFGVQSIAMGTDGSVWAGIYGHNDNTYIWHLSETASEYWTLPDETCEDCLSISVVYNAINQPVVIDHILSSDETEKKAKVYTWNSNE